MFWGQASGTAEMLCTFNNLGQATILFHSSPFCSSNWGLMPADHLDLAVINPLLTQVNIIPSGHKEDWPVLEDECDGA